MELGSAGQEKTVVTVKLGSDAVRVVLKKINWTE